MKKYILLLFSIIFPFFVASSFGQSLSVSVSIPQEGTSEFCGKFYTCFIPMEVLTQIGSKVTWTNDDLTSTHTVTGGDVVVGPDGKFNSGSLGPTQKFSFIFEEVGIYPYYCMIHPWKEGLIKIIPEDTSPRSDPQLSQVEKLKQENALLKQQIQDLHEEITRLRQLVLEQMQVIFKWVSSR